MSPERLREIATELLEGYECNVRAAAKSIKKELWIALLEKCRWSIRAAAKAAGIKRTDSYILFKRLGIKRP